MPSFLGMRKEFKGLGRPAVFLCPPLWIWNRILLFNRSYSSIRYRFSHPLPALLSETLCFNKILLGGPEESFDWKVLMLKGRQ